MTLGRMLRRLIDEISTMRKQWSWQCKWKKWGCTQ